MKEKVLEEIKELKMEREELVIENKKNSKRLELLKKDKKVLEAIQLLQKNNEIVSKISNSKDHEHSIITDNCTHDLYLYMGTSHDWWEGRSYGKYRCLECGKIYETRGIIGNVIKSDIDFCKLQNEYFKLLFKYNEKDAIEIMMYKYNAPEFNTLVENGIDEIKALSLVKQIKNK